MHRITDATAPYFAHTLAPALPTTFIEGVAELLSFNGQTLQAEDVRYTIGQASTLLIGRAEASGPDRAEKAIAEALAQLHPHPAQTGRLLLALLSRVDAELTMDGLDLILEALQASVGQDWELVFSHCVSSTQQAELRLIILQAFGVQQ